MGDTIKEPIELKLSSTNISIKRGTKKLLDELGTRKDSYYDIIRRLIKEKEKPIFCIFLYDVLIL